MWIYFLNPLVTIVLSFQRFIYGTVAPRDHPISARDATGSTGTSPCSAIILVVSVLLFLLAMLVFGRVEGNFAEEL